MANIGAIDKPGGWLISVIKAGEPPLIRNFYVYEIDRAKAIALASTNIPVTEPETIKVVGQVNTTELTGHGLRPGDVKFYG
jgi:hypothetical protein